MHELMPQPQLVHYVPIATTILSAIFCGVLLRRYSLKGTGAHLLWWAGGIACYGLGTATESMVTLFGNSPALNKAWYIAGALLGGYPLAQGSVYLLLNRRVAHILTSITVPFIILFSILVILSPVNLDALLSARLGAYGRLPGGCPPRSLEMFGSPVDSLLPVMPKILVIDEDVRCRGRID